MDDRIRPWKVRLPLWSLVRQKDAGVVLSEPDPRPEGRIRDGALLKALHREWLECVLCHSIGLGVNFTPVGLSLHHVNKHPRDDVRENLVMLCGSGTTGCHGRIEARDPVTCKLLGEYIVEERPDVVEHLEWRLGGADAASEWLQRHLHVSS